MKLANDDCRCLDSTCPLHETCLRWVDRMPTGKGYQRYVITATLMVDGVCLSHVPIEDRETESERGEGHDTKSN